MYGFIVDLFIAFIFYSANLYQRVFITGMLHGAPLRMLTTQAEDQQSALDFAAGVADMAGHESIADTLRIALNHMKQKDNMETFSQSIELLLSPKLDHDQYLKLKSFNQKVDAILALGKAFPAAVKGVEDTFAKVSGGKLSIQEIDDLMHAAIKGYEDSQQ